MSGTAGQSKAEARLSLKDKNDNTFSSEKAKNSTENEKSLGERKKRVSSKFALRNPSIYDENNQTIISSLLLPDATIASKMKNSQSWTVNKLRFNSVGLLGRENEQRILSACWDRMMLQPAEQQTKEVVMISGYSGTGKTTLAFDLKKRKMKKGRGAFVTGKFDQYHSGEPRSAISQAFGELCRMVAKKGAAVCEEIENVLRAKLKSEVYVLAQIIPDLKKVINQKTEHTKTSYDTTSDARQTKLNYAFR
eukprot:12188553-Ditylum_brightwellii.AAC.1